MGDLHEFTQWPQHQNAFYKITSSALLFEVMGLGNAAVGLAKKPGDKCSFWVILGYRQRCWIKKAETRGHSVAVEMPHILSPNEYRKFWISWSSGSIKLGRNGETIPIVKYVHKIPPINYVTFSLMALNNPIHWRFELPPVLKRAKLKPVIGGHLQWVAVENQLPDEALIGGYENETLYIIRTHYRGSLTPGKFVPSEGLGFIPWGGGARETSEMEVLCGYNCTWMPTCNDRIPAEAVIAGYSEADRGNLYVGRAHYDGHIIPGKVQPSHKVCYIAYDGREIAVKKYEILIWPENKVRYANRYLISHIDINMSESDDSSAEDDDEDNSGHEDNLEDRYYHHDDLDYEEE